MRKPSLVPQADDYAATNVGYAPSNALQELNKTYLELAIKNSFNMFNVAYALSRVTTPAQLIDLQQKVIRESVGAAIRDSQRITPLIMTAFIAAFRPAKG